MGAVQIATILATIAKQGLKYAVKKYGQKKVDNARLPENKPYFNKYNKVELKREIKKQSAMGKNNETRNRLLKEMKANFKARFGPL
tara:strand:+ start:87 stop:344 length:258 start_codon:yes stop_codon:yes gene_type:complete